MKPLAVVALYPIWAVAGAVGVTALRLGRATGRGLVVLCFLLALWTTGLVLLASPDTTSIAERVLPIGMLLGAGFVHAREDIATEKRPRSVIVTYAATSIVAILGLASPRLLYGPGAVSPGPLFFPIAGLASLGTALTLYELARDARRAKGGERRRLFALTLGCLLGALGGGGVIALRVLGLGDVELAAPVLLPAVLLATYAVLTREAGRARDMMAQGLTYAAITAALSSIGLTAYFALLPRLTPGHGDSLFWIVLVTFLAALPLDPLRLLFVERAGRLLFAKPIGVLDLAGEVERHEERADHAERLAEIGRLASAVAHEIRNPLGVIAAQAKLLERKGASATSVAAIRAQVDRAKHFLDDLLRYSKPRPLEVSTIDVGASLATAMANVVQSMGDTSPSIDVTPLDAPIALDADRRAFEDVATVLLQNAAIATSEKDGSRVRVTAREDGDAVIVLVEDDGPGVPEAIASSLFQPFVTGRGRDEKHPGTGLGLAIAARWVERHGGALSHEVPAGGGARFVARWPR